MSCFYSVYVRILECGEIFSIGIHHYLTVFFICHHKDQKWRLVLTVICCCHGEAFHPVANSMMSDYQPSMGDKSYTFNDVQGVCVCVCVYVCVCVRVYVCTCVRVYV